MAYYYLDEQSRGLIARSVGKVGMKNEPRDTAVSYPLAELARATTSVDSLSVGTFQLLKNKPDALVDGADTRDAYALCALNVDDTVELHRYRGEASGGFWGATKCNVDASPCICGILSVLEKLTDLTSHLASDFATGVTMQEKITEVKTDCECGIVCGACLLPVTIQLTVSGWLTHAGLDIAYGEYSLDDVSAMNGTISLPFESDDGTTKVWASRYILNPVMTNLAPTDFSPIYLVSKMRCIAGDMYFSVKIEWDGNATELYPETIISLTGCDIATFSLTTTHTIEASGFPGPYVFNMQYDGV